MHKPTGTALSRRLASLLSMLDSYSLSRCAACPALRAPRRPLTGSTSRAANDFGGQIGLSARDSKTNTSNSASVGRHRDDRRQTVQCQHRQL